MRILVLTINYWPEQTGISAILTRRCEYLASVGHKVTVCTGMPYYPEWRIHPNYTGKLFSSEERNGVTILRSWMWVRNVVTSAKRVLFEASFLASSLLRAMYNRKPELLLVISPPLGLGLSAVILSRMAKIPSAENRIKLSAERDAFGMPRAIVDWRISEEEHRTVQVYAKVVDRFLNRLGLGPLEWRPELWEHDDSWLKLTRDTYHPMGGTRMGTNPSSSVVDPNLQVHGISNLFVSSCSVFPGGGSSNPTFTLMALALRLGTHLTSLCGAPVASYRSKRIDMATVVSQALAQKVNKEATTKGRGYVKGMHLLA
jgi:GMC oxidoreductase